MSSVLVLAPVTFAHPEDTGDADHDSSHGLDLADRDPSDALEEHDEVAEAVISEGETGKKAKNLALVGEGERLLAAGTTDVWVHHQFAYLGTFNEPCGTRENYVAGVGEVDLVTPVTKPGVPIFDVRNKNRPSYEEDFDAWEMFAPPSDPTFGEGDPPHPCPGPQSRRAPGTTSRPTPPGTPAPSPAPGSPWLTARWPARRIRLFSSPATSRTSRRAA